MFLYAYAILPGLYRNPVAAVSIADASRLLEEPARGKEVPHGAESAALNGQFRGYSQADSAGKMTRKSPAHLF